VTGDWLAGESACRIASSSAPGIENFHQVDSHVYRGAQPTEEGFKYQTKVGVQVFTPTFAMKYINVPMTGLTPPTEAEISRILDILENNPDGAVFVHCKRGADRTGAVIASYRIDHDGWDHARALMEARADGMSFFQLPRQAFISAFQARKPEAETKTTTAAGGATDLHAGSAPVVAQ
jgi:hypothetical protein